MRTQPVPDENDVYVKLTQLRCVTHQIILINCSERGTKAPRIDFMQHMKWNTA
jgi:hypothetical protein